MGILNLVATPIGNLEDITLRALRIFKEADFILCEDTRVTKKLLSHYSIAKPLISYHQHSTLSKSAKIIELLRAGKNLALITDAGTPGISDPGSQLVSEVRRVLGTEVEIFSIPGASALTAALSLAGNGFDKFLFLGFLPHKKGRQKLLQEIISSPYAVVLYESKHRILKLLNELMELEAASSVGSSNKKLDIGLARELTKLHESFYFGSPGDVKVKLEASLHNLKGEFTVLIRPY